MSDPLSVTDAAAELPDRPAILADDDRSLTFAACARLAHANVRFSDPADAAEHARCRVVVATRTKETIIAVHAALEAKFPIALLDPGRAPNAVAQQRIAVASSRLPAETAVVLFTSGSTGEPRGVALSRVALIAAANASAAHLGWRDDDCWLVALPLAHVGGLAIAIRCLAARRPLVLAGDDLAASLERATLASLVPTQLASLLDDPVWRPPPRLRAVLLGGAAAPRALLDAAAARGVPFLATYGMTETFGQIATAPLARAGDPTALPVPLAGVEIDAAPPARIRVRAPMLATCYLDGEPIAPAFTTSDLGELVAGALRVIGRADNTIITGGRNVHPAEIEAALAATPGVRAACAFAVPDERWGSIVGAAIAVDPSFELDRALAHWHAALPPHARPRSLAIRGDLPQLPSGKTDRRAAAALAATVVDYHRKA